MRRLVVFTFMGGASLLLASHVSALTLGTPKIVPSVIEVDTRTRIKVALDIPRGEMVPLVVWLEEVDERGRVLHVLGALRDNGVVTDAVRSDGVFTGSVTVKGDETIRRLRVAALLLQKPLTRLPKVIRASSEVVGLFSASDIGRITAVAEEYVADLPDGDPPQGDLSQPGLVVGDVPGDVSAELLKLTGTQEMVVFQHGSLVLLGFSVPNADALAGAVSLLGVLDGAGIDTRALRSTLAGHAFHRNGLEAGNMALTGSDIEVTFLPGKSTWYGGGLPRPAIYFVVNNTNQSHSILDDSVMNALIARQFFSQPGVMLDSATTVVHALLHAMIFRTSCFAGSLQGEEDLVSTLEVLLGRSVDVVNLPGSTQAQQQRQAALAQAVALGGSVCLGLLGVSTGLQVVAGDVPRAIPSPGQTVSTLNVGAQGTIADVNMLFRFTHQCEHDLRMVLRAPSGSFVIVMDRGLERCSGVSTVFTSDNQMLGPFFEGQQAAGAWTLTVTDDDHPGFSGTLDFWSLTLFLR